MFPGHWQVTCQLPEEHGGGSARVAWIDTEGAIVCCCVFPSLFPFYFTGYEWRLDILYSLLLAEKFCCFLFLSFSHALLSQWSLPVAQLRQ